MVGQRLGRDQPEAAEYCTWSGLHLAMLYMGTMSLGYIVVPEFFLAPFGGEKDANFAAAHQIAVVLLRFVALYGVSDAAYMVFTATLKGAGDTRFVMWMSISLAWAIMVVPSFVGANLFRWRVVPDMELWLRVYMRLGRGVLLALSHGALEEYAGY